MQESVYFETAQTMKEFCSVVTEEVKTALENETLEKWNDMVMLAALMSPWKASSWEDIIQEFVNTYKFTADIWKISMHLRLADENIDDVSVIDDIGSWLVSGDENVEITASIWFNDEKVAELGKRKPGWYFS